MSDVNRRQLIRRELGDQHDDLRLEVAVRVNDYTYIVVTATGKEVEVLEETRLVNSKGFAGRKRKRNK